MNILRLSTLSLTLAIAVITLGYVDSASATPVDCDPDLNSTHPKCKNEEATGGSITYKAALEGAFVFDFLDFVTNSKGNELTLTPAKPIKIKRPNDGFETVWNNVFTMPNPGPCNLLVPVPEFTVPQKVRRVDGLTIALPGRVGVVFGCFELDSASESAAAGAPVSVCLQLIGNCKYSGGTEPCEPFLPIPVDNGTKTLVGTSKIDLITFWIHAGRLKGNPQFEGCHTAHTDLLRDAGDPSTLVITARKCKIDDGNTPPGCTELPPSP